MGLFSWTYIVEEISRDPVSTYAEIMVCRFKRRQVQRVQLQRRTAGYYIYKGTDIDHRPEAGVDVRREIEEAYQRHVAIRPDNMWNTH